VILLSIIHIQIIFVRSSTGCLAPERKLGFFVKIKPPAHRAYAPEGKTKILTTGILIVFQRLKFESDPRGIGYAPMK
jgi:hypothetical protein